MALGLSSDYPLFDLLEGGAWSVHPTTRAIKTFKPLNSYFPICDLSHEQAYRDARSLS
jgi:hypothetical protein